MNLDRILGSSNSSRELDTLLRQPLDAELLKIESLRRKSLDSDATLGDHTDYNIGFEQARKNYEASCLKILSSVQEELTATDAKIVRVTEKAQHEKALVARLESENEKLKQDLEAMEHEVEELDAMLTKTDVAHVLSSDLIARRDGGAESTREHAAAQEKFFALYEETLMTARSCLFRTKNKFTPPTETELQALRRQVKALRQERPADRDVFNAALQRVEGIVEDVTIRASVATRDSVEGVPPSGPEASSGVCAEAEAILTRRKQQEEDFMKESAKLLHWCRQQKTDLEALTEPDHIQKFCSALEVNYKTMYDNFEMLAVMGQELIGKQSDASSGCRIESMLMEANEVWLNLLVYAHEILQHTMLEIHARSKLEDEVRAFSTYSTRFRETLSSLREMFTLPMDEESKEVVAGVLEQTEALETNFVPFQDLSEQLKDFSLRMECIRDNYQNLRRTVLSRLTFLTPQNQATTAGLGGGSGSGSGSGSGGNTMRTRRLEEYNGRMKDLNEWITRKDMGESCSEIYGRIQSIKELIDREYENVQQDMKKLSTFA